MTYQEFIIAYPWIDIALEIFKGVMPTIIALVTVFVTQWCISKRERRNKRNDKKLEYYEIILKWFIEMKTRFLDAANQLEKLLADNDMKQRSQKDNEFMSCISKMNTDFVTWYTTYNSVVKAFGDDLDLSGFEKGYKESCKTLRQIKEKYVQKVDTVEATEEINNVIALYKEAVDATIILVTKEIGEIY